MEYSDEKNNQTRKAYPKKKRCRTENLNFPTTPDDVLGHISFRQGQSIAVSVNDFKGTLYVDTREWNWVDGKSIPTRKGICFPAALIEAFEELLTRAKQIRDA